MLDPTKHLNVELGVVPLKHLKGMKICNSITSLIVFKISTDILYFVMAKMN